MPKILLHSQLDDIILNNTQKKTVTVNEISIHRAVF